MKAHQDGWSWTEIGFADWRGAVDRRLEEVYLITIDDAGIDEERLSSHWQMKQPPYEFVEWFGNKYDLDPKSAFGL
jgi:hypothetical protein